MEARVGEQSVGAFARTQLEAARRDPRLDRIDSRAVVADFWDAMEEAERVRTLGLMGLSELANALEREEEKLGLKHDAADLNLSAARSLQAAYERSEWAKAELANGSPHANAQALISMISALDAMVEALAKFWRSFLVEQVIELVTTTGRKALGAIGNEVDASMLAALDRAVRSDAERMVPQALRPRGGGALRYEKPLKRVGLSAPEDRPVPVDLDAALAELGALRDVLVHRAGRIDQIALEQAPTLRYEIGQFVRISREDYCSCSAAVRCYAYEIAFRGIRRWPEVSDAQHGPELSRWRDHVSLYA